MEIPELDCCAVQEWFRNKSSCVRCSSAEELQTVLNAAGKYDLTGYSGAFDRIDNEPIYLACTLSGNNVGWGSHQDIENHRDRYEITSFHEFVYKFDISNRPSLLEILSA